MRVLALDPEITSSQYGELEDSDKYSEAWELECGDKQEASRSNPIFKNPKSIEQSQVRNIIR